MREKFERLEKYMKTKGLNDNQVTVQCSLSQGLLNQCRTGKSDLGPKTIDKILNIYQDLSRVWLLTGEGPMLVGEHGTDAYGLEGGIPLLPVDAMAGALSGGYEAIMSYDCERFIVPAFKGADFLIRVQGDSMEPKYLPGDIVACKKVLLERLWFQWGKTYLIDTSQGALIKRIEPSCTEGCVSINSENQKYKPFDLPVEEINGVALVIGTIRVE